MPQPALGLVARAVVDRVVDGDTVDLHITLPVRVRMLRCWAPEIHGKEKPQGLQAKAFLESLIKQGAPVRVRVPTGQADALGDVLTLGRVLGEIWVDGSEESLSELMVAAGMATPEKTK